MPRTITYRMGPTNLVQPKPCSMSFFLYAAWGAYLGALKPKKKPAHGGL